MYRRDKDELIRLFIIPFVAPFAFSERFARVFNFHLDGQ